MSFPFELVPLLFVHFTVPTNTESAPVYYIIVVSTDDSSVVSCSEAASKDVSSNDFLIITV